MTTAERDVMRSISFERYKKQLDSEPISRKGMSAFMDEMSRERGANIPPQGIRVRGKKESQTEDILYLSARTNDLIRIDSLTTWHCIQDWSQSPLLGQTFTTNFS